MEATTAQANDLERRVDLSIAISNVEKEMEQRLKRMGKNMKMSGFRPGKVPFSIVKQQHGDQARHEVLSEELDRVFGEAVTTQQMRVAGYPRIEPKVTESTTHLEFSAIFEAIPENTEELDIIEGDTGSWHFFGVQLKSNNTNQQELCRLSIINAYENDRDITSIIKSRRAYLTLYLDNGELCLANVHPLHNSQSWGKLIVEDYERARTNDGSIDKISYAKWYYQNSYDNKTGVALVAIGQREYTNMAFVQISTDNKILHYTTEIQGNMDIIQRDENVKTHTPKSKNSNTPNKRRTLQKNPNFKIE